MSKRRPRPGTLARTWRHPYWNKFQDQKTLRTQAEEELTDAGIRFTENAVPKVHLLGIADTDSQYRRPHHNLRHERIFIPRRRSAQLRARQKRDGMRFSGEEE